MTEPADRPSAEPVAPDDPQPAAAPETYAVRPGTGPPGRVSLGWTELAVGVVAYLALSVGLALAVFVIVGGAAPTVVQVALAAAAALGAAGLAVSVRVRSLKALGVRRVSLRWLLLGLAGGVLGWLVNRGVIVAYFAITGDTSNPQQGLAVSATGSLAELAALLVVGAIAVPAGEELLFRGVFYGALRRYGVVVSTIASALVFGLAHGVNVVLPAAIILGVINAVLYERSTSIWPSVVAHAVNNAIIFVTAALFLN